MDTLLERFCRYVKQETTAREDSGEYPSSTGQWELARQLAQELQGMGLEATISDHAIVSAVVPGNVDGAPKICWLAHMDTSPEASGKGVNPQVIKNYSGGSLTLPNGAEIPAEDLHGLEGKTIVTTDGTTLLGADDKSGIAVIVTAVERLLADSERPRCEVEVLFTCDEEIGCGTDKLDLSRLGAVCAYTLDGEGEGLIENETFSADLAVVKIRGKNIHPGLAYQKMVNAVRAAGTFLEHLPADLSLETTRAREPFLHPYVVKGGVDEVTVRILLRSFCTEDLVLQAELLQKIATEVMDRWPNTTIDIEIKEQYRNMAQYLAGEPRAVSLAERAYKNVGVEPKFRAIRGGTDGSRLSELGLPTPNLSTGMHNFHSEKEFACLEEMETAVRILLELATLWSEER